MRKSNHLPKLTLLVPRDFDRLHECTETHSEIRLDNTACHAADDTSLIIYQRREMTVVIK